MRIIVTGGYGFIGSSFVNHIRSIHPGPGTKILVIDKLTYAADKGNVTAPNINFLHKDICDVTAEELGEYDYLVHFAAESHVDNSITDGKPFIRTNVEGTFNLLECARQNKNLKKFIHISTDEVYGDMDDPKHKSILGIKKKADEEDSLEGSSYYSATKAASDLLVLAANRTFGLPYIITRTCNNYGSHQHKEKFLPTIIKSIKEGKEVPVYGDGKNVREWINVEDNVQQLYNLMLSDLTNEIFNIGTSETYTNLDIVGMIGVIMKKPVKFKYVKDRLGHDRRYALNSNKLNKHGFINEYKTLVDFLTNEIKKLN
jgi:dTDP-glucose 4,6-dehydratase